MKQWARFQKKNTTMDVGQHLDDYHRQKHMYRIGKRDRISIGRQWYRGGQDSAKFTIVCVTRNGSVPICKGNYAM